jgi:ParB-like chromosome segregation protein Spo0J
MFATVTRPAKGVTVRLDAIGIPSTTRPYSATAVVDLKRSIAAIGLQSAPTVVERDGRYLLVAGRHRLEALKLLGIESVLVRVVDFDDVEARMWTISENLHRAELPALQRAQQVAEYVELSNRKRAADQSAQVAPIESKRSDGRGHRPESGDRLASRELGIPRDEIRRAQVIASLPDATLAAAEDLELDDNQSALLAAARAEEPEEQIEVLESIAAHGSVAAARGNGIKPLRNLENIAAGEFARWIKVTTPNDRSHVIRVLEEAAAILQDELEAGR